MDVCSRYRYFSKCNNLLEYRMFLLSEYLCSAYFIIEAGMLISLNILFTLTNAKYLRISSLYSIKDHQDEIDKVYLKEILIGRNKSI